jgi:hypothetical protein
MRSSMVYMNALPRTQLTASTCITPIYSGTNEIRPSIDRVRVSTENNTKSPETDP